MTQEIFTRLDGISKRLEKRDLIESSVSSMKNEITNLSSRVCEVEKSQKFIAQSFEDNDINTMKALDDLLEFKKKVTGTLY